MTIKGEVSAAHTLLTDTGQDREPLTVEEHERLRRCLLIDADMDSRTPLAVLPGRGVLRSAAELEA